MLQLFFVVQEQDQEFGKDAFEQLGCSLDYSSRLVYVKQLMIPLVLGKEVTVGPKETAQVALQAKYTLTSYQSLLDSQGRTMIFMYPTDKCSAFYPVVTQFVAN